MMVTVCVIQSVRQECSDLTHEISVEWVLIYIYIYIYIYISVAQSCMTLSDPKNGSTPGLPVQHQLPEFTEIYVHRASDAIQPFDPL